MTTKFFTNEEQNSLFNKFKGIFEYQKIHNFDALVGFFRSSGYFKVRKLLDDVPEIRILVGINIDKLSQKYHSKGLLYLKNPNETKEEFLNELINDIEEADYKKDIEEGIIQFINDIISEKVKIKASGDKRLHAKIYIFRPKPFNEHTPASVITGSSNMTDSGLGTTDIKNYEFNVLLQDYADVKFATDEFEKLWSEAEDILPAEINKIKYRTHLNDNITPFELYIKVLIEYFGNSIEYDPTIGDDLPKGYLNLKYQSDAVSDGFNRMLKHRGFILADVVGLGKTVIATQIVKKYIQKNGAGTRVLIIYPPALESNWKNTIKDFKLTNYIDFVTNGSLHKVIDPENLDYQQPEFYDLIVVDESHKFRTDTSQMYALLQIITKTPRINIGNDRDRRKKVILISATPLNNRPEDIANQIYLFQDARSSTIDGVYNLQKFFASKIREYKNLRKVNDHNELVKKVKEIYLPIRDKIMAPLVIRRTRSDILCNPEYVEDMKKQGLKFPDVIGPKNLKYTLDDKLNELFYRTVEFLTDTSKNGLGYFRYRAIEYLKPEYQELYDNARLISHQLAMIMRTLMVKRLESSFFAFKQSLQRFHDSNQRMIDMFEKDKIYIAPDLDVNQMLAEGKEDELEARINALNEELHNNAIYKQEDFEPNFINGLKKDQEILNNLVAAWSKVDSDPKLERFFEALKGELFNASNIERKLVIFTESKETVDYLAKELQKRDYKNILAISSENQKHRFNVIRANFDANYPREKKDDHNILITTDVLAEGINLHRSNVILNYDIPWNATRLMQRIGRVNRIGTKADKIYVYNFEPSAEGDAQIQLNEKALKKLQGFHTALSEDSKVYSELEQLQENILGEINIQEEIDERLQYLFFIRKFKEKNPHEFEKIKKLPLKTRTGRNYENILLKNSEGKEIYKSGTIAYLRSKQKDAFYFANDHNVKELTFLEAIKILEAQQEEKPSKLPENHFDQVEKAIQLFIDSTEFIDEDGIIRSDLGGQERRAIKLLNDLQKLRNNKPELYDDEFAALIETSVKVIYMGIFKKFRNDIARLAKNVKKQKKKPSDVINELRRIINSYPISQIQKMEEKRLNEQFREKEESLQNKPRIIITESIIGD